MDVQKFYMLAVLLSVLLSEATIDAQDTSGFISIDCGTPEDTNYNDTRTGINYISDEGLINTGEIYPISPDYTSNTLSEKPYLTVRSFPEGKRNCYILKPASGKSNKYLIRATFLYGNYDGQNKLPQFDLHLGVDYWYTVNITQASLYDQPEIVHVPPSDTIYICLVNTGKGTPFISSLELRPLNNTMYPSDSGSLSLFVRFDMGNNGLKTVRYKDDIYDRIWLPLVFETTQATINTTSIVDSPTNFFRPPSTVMSTASTPLDPTLPLTFNWDTDSVTDRYYIYMYFAELEKLQPNQTREFNIFLNGGLYFNQPINPLYLRPQTLYGSKADTNYSKYDFSFIKTKNSTLPPVLNALEAFKVVDILHAQTGDLETAAMYSIKSSYRISRNWQGDPCAPQEYVWDGVNCSYNGFNSPKVISLNLSSSGITSSTLAVIANLSNLQTLDLSNNKLTGRIPDFLGHMFFLKVLNIKGNNFTGPIPSQLLTNSQIGSLLLSADGLPINEEVKKKKSNVVLPIVASMSALFVILILLAALWIVRMKQRESQRKSNNMYSLESKNKQFTYSEILSITNNLQTIIGRGGFGIVYHGKIGDTEVAVKMFSSASMDEGFKELVSEFNVLIHVHHKNLTSLVGYCIDGEHLGIIYEYMANGDLKGHLSERNLYVLNWQDRLQIALDAAQGLEYLHHGIKNAIVHRDVKCTNILLDEKLRAKIADFGLSRAYPAETVTHVSTNRIAGTPGYLDPEYQNTGRLTEKSDIYSFGIVILEILTGKPAIMDNNPNPPINLKNWVGWIMQQGDMKDIVDPRLMGEFEVTSAKKAVEIAMACVSQESADRPTMTQVVMALKECLAMETIPQEKTLMDSDGQIFVHSKSMSMSR
ncbi:hypothetical protein LIER_22055 [Lithospermum erythrorhizon]|uniref:non-specific serine/threonine protein kinase n=1 Tax=Lithospermum erythrorhizon TaxID=34254 RepID=A0AAV3QSF5_LITER